MAKKQFEVIVPTEWKDITIAEYQRYLQIAKSNRRTRDNEIISLFCNYLRSVLLERMIQKVLFLLSKLLN